MVLGGILFSIEAVKSPGDGEKDNLAEPMIGNKRVLKDLFEGNSERPVMKNQEELPQLTDQHVYQSISVITADY